LMYFWHIRSLFSEECSRLTQFLELEEKERAGCLPAGERALQRARGLRALKFQSQYINISLPVGPVELLQESIALLRGLGPTVRRELGISILCFLDAQCILTQSSPLQQEMLTIFEQESNKFYLSEYFGGAGEFLFIAEKYEEAKVALIKGQAITDEIGDLDGKSHLFHLSQCEWHLGNAIRAKELMEEAIRYSRLVKNRWWEALCQSGLASIALAKGNYAEANQLCLEALAQYRECDFRSWLNAPLGTLQLSAWSEGDLEKSIRYGHEILELFADSPCTISCTNYILERAAISQGDLLKAGELLGNAITNLPLDLNTVGSGLKIALILGRVALSCQELDTNCASKLLGAVDIKYKQEANTFTPRERSEHAENLATCRSALGEEAFNAAFAAGQQLGLDGAIQELRSMLQSIETTS
jgi:tetratricopeptide (TPR) repeat protein